MSGVPESIQVCLRLNGYYGDKNETENTYYRLLHNSRADKSPHDNTFSFHAG